VHSDWHPPPAPTRAIKWHFSTDLFYCEEIIPSREDRGKEKGKTINQRHKQPTHWTLEETGDAFLMLRAGARGGVLGRLDDLGDPITGAALHRGALWGG